MNIVYISKYLVLPKYGAPTRQYFLAKYLARITDNSVLLVGSRSSLSNIPSFKDLSIHDKSHSLETVILNGPQITPGFSLRRVWSWIIFEKNLFLFRKKIRAFRPDVVIVSSLSILTFLSGIFLKRWLKIPLVIEVRDLYPLTLEELGQYSSRNPLVFLLRLVEKAGYRSADYIISTLPNAGEHIAYVLKRPFNFDCIPMGIDEEYFKDCIREDQTTIFKNPGKFVVMYAGTIGKANALDIVFEAAKMLDRTHPQIEFVIIGDGPLKSLYTVMYSGLKNVMFLPSVRKNELQNYLQLADILINPWLDKSIYRFGISPNKWIDYMYAAKPIVVSYNGYRSILNDAHCGIFTPAEDAPEFAKAIVDLSKKPKGCLEQMGEHGKNYLVSQMSYKQLAEKLNYILKKTVQFKTNNIGTK